MSKLSNMRDDLPIVCYGPFGSGATFKVDPANETIWASQAQIAETFDLDRRT